MSAVELLGQLAAALAPQYRLERELGGGGMSRVFLAEETTLGRRVVVKVLPSELAAGLNAERFRREMQVAARLQHPHLVPLLTAGEAAGVLYYTAPFVEGESLRARLEREPHLPIEEAVRLARELASALDYAHRQGVVHRDVKPDNILLADGHAMLTDFGIARALGGVAGETLTGTGLSLGTPAYMAPEQATGERDVDGRADLYALGCVSYEMLSGQPPYAGPTAQSLVAQHVAAPIPSTRALRPAVSPALDAAIQRAMAKQPVDRFATGAQFALALKAAETGWPTERSTTRALKQPRRARPLTVVVAVIALAALGFAAWRVTERLPTPPSQPAQPSLAVLPFENLGDSADAYFADGVTDEVRGKLSAIRQLRVIASTSSGQYRGSTKPPSVIARDLGVRYLLVGRVRWQKTPGAPSRVRVDPELVDVTGGPAPRTTWQQPFDAELSDVFRVQSEIAERVAGELRVALAAGERSELASIPTGSLDAYDAYLRGRELRLSGGLDPTSLRRAAAAFREAVTRDSTFVRGWTSLAATYVVLAVQPSGSPHHVDSARVALERARALGVGQPDVQVSAAAYEGLVLGRWDRALATATSALAQNPNHVRLLYAVAMSEEALGLWDSAAVHLRRALELDPRSVALTEDLGRMARLRGRLPEARTALDRALSLQPADADARVLSAMVELDAGDVARARAVLRDVPTDVDSIALLAKVGEWGLSWLLDDTGQQRLLTLGSAEFGGSRAAWGLALADAHALRGDSTKARAYADSASAELRAGALGKPNDAERWAWAGLGFAYAGYKAKALQAAERALEQTRVVKNRRIEQTVHDYAVRALLVAGERERALTQLEAIPPGPASLSSAWLRIDPHYIALRSEPRFERLTIAR